MALKHHLYQTKVFNILLLLVLIYQPWEEEYNIYITSLDSASHSVSTFCIIINYHVG